jgi:hypothetical protein
MWTLRTPAPATRLIVVVSAPEFRRPPTNPWTLGAVYGLNMGISLLAVELLYSW